MNFPDLLIFLGSVTLIIIIVLRTRKQPINLGIPILKQRIHLSSDQAKEVITKSHDLKLEDRLILMRENMGAGVYVLLYVEENNHISIMSISLPGVQSQNSE